MTDVAEIGNRIADEIESKGHWQGGEQDGCCIVTSDAFFFDTSSQERFKFIDALTKRLGLGEDVVQVYNWNDTTPTDVVVKTLRDL